MMKATLPVVLSKASVSQAFLHLWLDQHRHQVQLDTPAWFAFLAQERSFRFVYHLPQGGTFNLTIRPEKRGQRTHWQAWKSHQGKTIKKYLASSAKLSKAKLDAIADRFAQDLQAQDQADPSLPLYAAVDDLAWLVQRLLEHCSQPDLISLAQRELARIQRQIRA